MTTTVRLQGRINGWTLWVCKSSDEEVLIANFTDGPLQRRLFLTTAEAAAQSVMADEIEVDANMSKIKALAETVGIDAFVGGRVHETINAALTAALLG